MSVDKIVDGIVIKKFDPSLTDQVVAFLFDQFIPDEPLWKSFNLKGSPTAERYIKYYLDMDVSFVAFDTEANNKLVGVRLSGITRKGEKLDLGDIEQEIKYLLQILDDGFDQLDIYNKYNTDFFLEGVMLSVHRDYRGRGIAIRMMEVTLEFMKENKIPLCYIACTSSFTVGVLKKFGFESILEMPYDEYKIDGKRIFYPEEPHKGCTFCVKVV